MGNPVGMAVEIAQYVLSMIPGTVRQNHAGDHHENPAAVRGGQGEHVRAFVNAGHPGLVAEAAGFLPVNQIFRGEKFHMVARGHRHAVFSQNVVPEKLGVPVIGHAGIGNHGIPRPGGKMHPVFGKGHALLLGFPGGGVHQGDFSADDAAAAGPAGPQVVGIQGDGQMPPVNQVVADGVRPVHGADVLHRGIMLGEKVIRFSVKQKAVGVVDPALFGGIMKPGPVIPCAVNRHRCPPPVRMYPEPRRRSPRPRRRGRSKRPPRRNLGQTGDFPPVF